MFGYFSFKLHHAHFQLKMILCGDETVSGGSGNVVLSFIINGVFIRYST